MATTTNTKTTAKKKTTASKPAAKKPAPKPAPKPTPEKTVEAAPVIEERPVAKEIDVNQYVRVKNGFHGHLVYKSPHTGEVFEWGAFGDEQDMQLSELKSAKNSSKGFFINNWFMFDDPWVIDYLGVRMFYKNALTLDEFDTLFDKSPEEVADIISEMSDGQKSSVKYYASEKIRNGEIDSRKMIATLEEALGVQLIEG